MFRLATVACAASMFALACGLAFALDEGFSFTIGSPVAAQDFHMKTAAFVFRTERCAEPARAQISATAEGLLKGDRRSLSLNVVTSSKPGVYAVFQSWPREGDWVVSLKGTCAGAQAGAIIPIGQNGFVRESSKFFPRPATDAEVGDVLNAWSRRTNK
jgi:hypothetical protein